MSTYTDLHNRVKESLTVDYHSRITPQVISALNPENEFWGKFRGSFVGDVQISSLSDSVIFDSDFVRGRTLSSTMDSPKLFLSVDEESGEDVVQDLTAYIAEHGSGGITPADLSALEVSVVSAEPGTGYSAKYVVTQGGEPIGMPIEVPEAGVVKDATVRMCEEDNVPIEGLKKGDKYLDIELNVRGGAEKHVYVSLKDLTDVYTAGEGLVLSGSEFSVSASVLADIKAHGERLSVLSTYAETSGQLSNDGYLTFESFSQAQMSALDSGITAGLVHDYSTHIANHGVHVTSADKENWNGKYNKPLSGIPKTDLDADVQVSLGKADTALQEHQSLSDYYTKAETSSATEIGAGFGAVESDIGFLAQASADHDGRISALETGAMMLSGGEFTGGVSFKKGEADLSACFAGVVDSDDHALSDFLDPLPESVTVFGVCVRINDMIRFSGKGVDPVPYDTTNIEDVFGTVKELTGVEPTDIGSVRTALNGALAALTLGSASRTLEGRLGILSERDDGIIERVDALSAEVAKGSALAEVSAFLSSEIDKKADSSELTAYALSADVMSRETVAGRFDGVNGRIDGVLAKLKGVYSALSGLPSNPAEFNLIENVAPALIALRSALSAFA